MPLQESLEAAGHQVHWRQQSLCADAQRAVPLSCDLVIGDAGIEGCEDVVQYLRSQDPPPALLLIVHNDEERSLASFLEAKGVANTAQSIEFLNAVDDAIRARFTAHMSGAFARGFLRLGPATTLLADAKKIVFAARSMDLAPVRECLRPKRDNYVCKTALVSEMRKERMLTIPEVEMAGNLDGSETIGRLVSANSGDGATAGRYLWALISCGGATCTDEPPDLLSPKPRATFTIRQHLRARNQRLDRATHYDVLEVDRITHPDIVEQAARALAIRYSPERLKGYDLGNLAFVVDSAWQQILLARKVLTNLVDRANYDDWLDSQDEQLKSSWAFDYEDPERASDAFAKGQHALVQGEAFSAVSNFAAACRAHPDNADYETYLCWAKFRAAKTNESSNELLETCRTKAEVALLGRRPWPQALIALALLSAAAGDTAGARYHLEEALLVEPQLAAAKALLARLPS